MGFSPTYNGFCRFCKAVGYDLAPFQRLIARAVFSDDTEVAAVLPRGQAKSTLAALLALHHVLSRDDPSVYIGASARVQARVIGRIVERYARDPAIARLLTVRLDEVRLGDRRGPTVLQIVSADGGRAHGWERPTLMIGDEVWGWPDRDPTLLGAMQTALVKNPEAKLLLISTAPPSEDTPLGRVRARALAGDLRRDGALIDAAAEGLRYLEWSVPDEIDPGDLRWAKKANPAPWITRDMLAAQRRRCSELEWLQFHANRSHVGSARWLPHGAWAACAGEYEIGDDEPWVIGVDVGGSRSATAAVAVVGDETGVRVADVRVWQGVTAVLEVTAYIEHQLAEGRRVQEIVADPMRFQSEMQRLERAHGVTVVEWPQTGVRMARCSEHLHGLIVENRLQHRAHPALDRHVANAIAVPVGGHRAWRLVKGHDAAQIDALVALAMAAERASQPAPTAVRLVGWL